MRSLMNQIHNLVEEEIREQDSRFGVRIISFPVLLTILMQEVGGMAQATNETIFDNGINLGGFSNIKKEAIQVAAVAMQIAERAYDRELSEC